jgi:proteasome lid subunit RPN8/RPN11
MDETPIKAVELVRSIRDQMYEETKGMSPDEFMAFIAREAGKAQPAAATAHECFEHPAA